MSNATEMAAVSGKRPVDFLPAGDSQVRFHVLMPGPARVKALDFLSEVELEVVGKLRAERVVFPLGML